ncbi:hypothetical protein [Bacillus mycoides]|nr:hypothetical protein [Bacillus mycoides]
MEKTNLSSKEARNLYMREYRKKNPEKIKQYNDNYWKKKAKEMEGQGCQK